MTGLSPSDGARFSLVTQSFLRETFAFLDLDLKGVSTDAASTDAMSYFRWRHGLEHARSVKGVFLP